MPATHSSPLLSSPARWQVALRDAIRDPVELCQLLDLPSYQTSAVAAAEAFGLVAPRSFVARMRVGDPADPLLRQVLPLGEELVSTPGFTSDPVGDRAATLAPGLLQKYATRVLLVATGACAVHCRYCFRRHYPYSQSPKFTEAWEPALAAIAADATLREVILSGGDPLTIVDEQLADLADQLSAIPHLTRLRIHTRLPVMIPQRIDDRLLAWLTGTRLTPIFVLHANHARELTGDAAAALARLADAGIPLLNQAVLLRGVNDDADTLVELSEALVDLRVMPYYLHQLDRVHGAAHFEVPLERGRELIAQMHARLPGYAVPRYVQEVEGEVGKSHFRI